MTNATRSRALTIGATIRVERDETRYPSRGTWPTYRGRTGTVLLINRAGLGATEYGVRFTKAKNVDAWFKAHELTVTGPGRDDETDAA